MDKERYAQYLDSLSRVLEDWERYKESTSVERMLKNRDESHKVCHVMFLAIQTAIDLANLIIAEKGLPRPSSYKEAFEILYQEKFLKDEEIANSLRNLASFRNILVHQYPKLNQEKAYRNLKLGLESLKVFQKTIAHYALNK